MIDVINKDGTGLRQVITAPLPGQTGGQFSAPAWTPDGKRISFVNRNRDTDIGAEGIWTVNADGSGLIHTIQDYSADFPNWSAANKLVYTCSFRARGWDLCLYDASTQSSGNLAIDPPPGFAKLNVELIPHWSPDGRTIVFALPMVSTAGGGIFPTTQQPIFTIKADGTGLLQLTQSSPVNCPDDHMWFAAPVFSPDGQSIIATATHRVLTGISAGSCNYTVPETGLWTLGTQGGAPSPLVDGAAIPFAAELDWQPIVGGLTFNIDDGLHDPLNGSTHPLNGLLVELRQPDGTPVSDEPINTAGGTYVFENVAPASYVVRATLVDNHLAGGLPPAFDILYAAFPTEPVWLESRFTIGNIGESHVIHFSQNNCDPGDSECSLAAYGPDGSSEAGTRLDAMADIFFRTRQFVDWVKTHLTADTHGTVAFYTFATVDPFDGTPITTGLDAYYDPAHTDVVLDQNMSDYTARDGIIHLVGTTNIQVLPFGAPANGEWHEFSHHLWRQFVNDRGTPPCKPNYCPHLGYNNPDTCDSMDEGFADFLPTLAGNDIPVQSGGDGQYDTFGYNISHVKFKPWGYTANPPYCPNSTATIEEFAVAGLFWDLVDDDGDSEATEVIGADGLHHSVTYTDTVSMPLRTLWNQLISSRPATVFALRSSFGTQSLTVDLDQDQDHINDVAPLDEVFLMHGMFPVDGDQTITASHFTYHYDVGYAQRLDPSALRDAAVGLTAHIEYDQTGAVRQTLLGRMNTPVQPNAFVGLHVLDDTGSPLSGTTYTLTLTSAGTGSGSTSGGGTYGALTANMDIQYPGGFVQTTSRQLASGDGALVHLELPSHFDYLLPTGGSLPACDPTHDFQVQVTLSAMRNGAVSTETPSFDNCTYQQAMAAAAGPPALSYTLTIPGPVTPTAIVSATPDFGSTFDGWSGPDATECATGSVAMTADKSCTATFSVVTTTTTVPTTSTTTTTTSTTSSTTTTLPPPSKCTAKKISIVVKKAAAETKCHAKAVGKGIPLDAGCLQAAASKFDAAWTKAEKPGNDCLTTGDQTSIEGMVDSFVADVATALGGDSPQSKCSGKKYGLVGKKSIGLGKCQAKAVGKGIPVDPACTMTVEMKFTTGWGKAESGGGCNTMGDEASLESTVEGEIGGIVDALEP